MRITSTFRRRLLVSAAVCALSAGTPAIVRAQTVEVPAGIFLEIEGGWAEGANDVPLGLDLSNYPATIFETGDGDGWSGTVRLGVKGATGWHAAARFAKLEIEASGAAGYYQIIPYLPGFGFVPTYYAPAFAIETEYQALDFEVGKEFGIGSGRLQVFGGIAFAEIDRKIEISSAGYPGYPYSFQMRHEFSGVGPKVGVRASQPLGSGFALVGSGAVGLLFGETSFDASASYYGYTLARFRREDDRTVPMLEGEAGLAFDLGPASVTVGYRATALFGALDTDQGLAPYYLRVGNSDDDFITHSAFVRATIPLGGGS